MLSLQDDFDQFLWTVVFLAMGGISLGKGVTSSGLLDVMDDIIRDIVDGLSLYTVVLVLSGIVLVSRVLCYSSSSMNVAILGRFYFHQSYYRKRAIGTDCQRSREQDGRKPAESVDFPHRSHLLRWNGYARLWVPEPNCVCGAIPWLHVFVLTSLSCSATQEDDMGQLYLTNIDFLKNGVPASIIATMVRFSSIYTVYSMLSVNCRLYPLLGTYS